MAFSTQREFFPRSHLFDARLECKAACTRLKDYALKLDARAWAQDSTNRSDERPSPVGVITIKDSLVESVNTKLTSLEEVPSSTSKPNAKVSQPSCDQLRALLSKKLDKNVLNEICNKLQKIIRSNKLSKSEQEDVACIQKVLRDLLLRNEHLEAQCEQLQSLVEKLRGQNAETSSDVKYPQREVKRLPNSKAVGDSEAVQQIMKECGELRKKLATIESIEKKVIALQQRLKQDTEVSNGLSSKVQTQRVYIQELERKLQEMQSYCDHMEQHYKRQTACLEEQLKQLQCYSDRMEQDCESRTCCLENQLKTARLEVCRAKVQLRRCESLQSETEAMRKQLDISNSKLIDYECQFKQLKGFVGGFVANDYSLRSACKRAETIEEFCSRLRSV